MVETTMEVESPRHRKKRPSRKGFAVEYSVTRYPCEHWEHYRNYATERQRDQAVEDLNRSHAGIGWRFRRG